MHIYIYTIICMYNYSYQPTGIRGGRMVLATVQLEELTPRGLNRSINQWLEHVGVDVWWAWKALHCDFMLFWGSNGNHQAGDQRFVGKPNLSWCQLHSFIFMVILLWYNHLNLGKHWWRVGYCVLAIHTHIYIYIHTYGLYIDNDIFHTRFFVFKQNIYDWQRYHMNVP